MLDLDEDDVDEVWFEELLESKSMATQNPHLARSKYLACMSYKSVWVFAALTQ